MPSLPAVMNELMSYTVTPIRGVSLLAAVSPAPHAVRPNPITPAEAIAAIFVVILIWFLSLSLCWFDGENGLMPIDHVRLRVDQTSTATAATISTPLMTFCQ